MSFAVPTVAPVTVTSVPQPSAGSTVTSGTVAVTDPNSASKPVQIGGTATVALGTEGARVVLLAGGSPSVTIGLGSNGSALGVGGSVIDGSAASSVVVDLAGGYFGGSTVNPSLIPSRAPVGTYNSYTSLSRGSDSFLGSEYNDLVDLSPGDDIIVGGGGDDAILMADSIQGSKKKFTLDGSGGNAGAGGSDTVTLTKGALTKGGKTKITISDYDAKQDTIQLETKRSKVKGIGTDTITISTKDNKTIKIISDGTKFKRSGIEFI